MSLIVETGAGLATAESYCDVATATQYHADRGNSAWSALTTAQQEQSLRKATDYIEQVYKERWQGSRINSTQALDWPRVGVIANCYYVLSTIVPLPVQRACAELALRASDGDLLADLDQQKKRSKVGEIEIEYSEYSPRQKQYAAIDAMLAPYFQVTGHRLVR